MKCVKTGAEVYFPGHGFLVRGDLYAIGKDMILLRWAPGTEVYNIDCLVPYIMREYEYGGTSMDWACFDLGIFITHRDDLVGEFVE